MDETELKSSLAALIRQFESLGLGVHETAVGRDGDDVLEGAPDAPESGHAASDTLAGLVGMLFQSSSNISKSSFTAGTKKTVQVKMV